MSVPTTYSELQAKVIGLMKRTGDTATEALAPDWIGYAESEMQTRIKLMEFETDATVTITDGSGSLPTGFLGARSVYWDGSPDYPLTYVTPDRFDYLRGNDSGDGHYYTITGATIRTTPMGSGSVVMTCKTRFAPLSDTDTSNAILASFPDAYLYGAMKHAYIYAEDDAQVQKYGLLFNAACDRINENNEQRKYGGTLTVRAR